MLLGPKFQKENINSRNGSFQLFQASDANGKVAQVLDIIKENYVDPIKTDSLEDLAINEILNNLDPHSAYLPPIEAKQFTDNMEGNYNGIGVEYQMVNDTLIITQVNKNGPAEKAGLKSGDQLIKVEDETIAGVKVTTKKVSGLIKGRQGTLVKLTVRRYESPADLIFQVPRDKITVSSIDVAYMLPDQIGYIKISQFGAKTDEDFLAELTKLQKEGMKGLIIDLRGNGGGYLNAATALADQFLSDERLIVYTKGEHEPRTDYFSTASGAYEKGKLVVLIDEGTASASEIIAGAIQDLDRGSIVGRRSFGKGLVQEQFNFGDGSSLNLTVARYFTPSGRSIQKSYSHGKTEYFQEVSNRMKRGEMIFDQKHVMDSLYATTAKHYKTESGRVVFGGGGIMPDIYVPIDTSGFNELYHSLSSKAVLNQFVYSNLIKNKRPENLQKLIAGFTLSDQQVHSLESLAKTRKVDFNTRDFQISRPLIIHDLKAMLARFYFGDDAYYRVVNEGDSVILRSLKVFKQP